MGDIKQTSAWAAGARVGWLATPSFMTYANGGYTGEAAIYDGELLEPEMAFEGPAIVEARGTTVVIHADDRVVVDAYGNLVITLGNAGLEAAA